MPFTTPLALLGLAVHPGRRRDVPAQAAPRRDGRAVHAAVEPPRRPTSRPTRRGSGCGAASCCCSSCCSWSLLALLAARPFLERPAGLARDIVLVIDTSASMAATDVAPNRLEAAKARGHRRAAGPADRRQGQRHRRRPERRGSSSTRRPTSGASARRSTASSRRRTPRRPRRRAASWPRQARGPVRRRPGPRRHRRGARHAADAPRSTAPIKVLPVGRDRKNQAIVALAVRTAPSAVTRSVFVSVANLDLEPAARRIELWGDGRLLEARDVLARPAGPVRRRHRRRARATSASLEVRLVGPDPAVDRRARPAGRRRPRLGGRPAGPDAAGPRRRRGRPVPRDRAQLPARTSSCTASRPTSTARRPSARTAGRGTSSSSRATLPATLPRRPILAIAPPTHEPARRRSTGTLKDPGIGVARARTSRSCATSTCRRPTSPQAHAADAPRLGADRHPGPDGRAAPLHRHPGRPADRGPGLRAAAVRPAAPGRLPDPAREPDRRAAGRLGGADRGRRARARRSASRSRPGATGLHRHAARRHRRSSSSPSADRAARR